MKIKDYEIWMNDPTTGAKTLSINKINSFPISENDKNILKNQINIIFNNLEQKIVSYKENISSGDPAFLTLFKQNLLQLFSYVSLKFQTHFENGPNINYEFLTCFDWFDYFSLDLPEYSDSWFSYSDDNGNVVLINNSNLETFTDSIGTGDKSRLAGFFDNFKNEMETKTNFMLFARPLPETQILKEGDPAIIIKEEFNVMEICEIFNWSIPGITPWQG